MDTVLGNATATLLAIAAIFLGLSLIVQVIQELFKFLTNSKARVYRMVLQDFFGPWVQQLYEAGPVARFHVRGPLQFFKSQPTGVLLPLDKEQLLEALDEVAPDWIGRTLEALKVEKRLQAEGQTEPSPRFATLIANLRREASAAPPHSNARKMLDFLHEWGAVDSEHQPAPSFSATALLEGLFQEFFPDRLRAEQEFGQLAKNFDHVKTRRNLRYSFLFGLLIAIVFDFPFDAIHHHANALSADEAIALAEEVRGIRQEVEDLGPTPTGEVDAATEEATVEERLQIVEKLVVRLDPTRQIESPTIFARGTSRMEEIWLGKDEKSRSGLAGIITYLFNCTITALLITFGAPFWDRLTEALLRVQRPGRAQRIEVEMEA